MAYFTRLVPGGLFAAFRLGPLIRAEVIVNQGSPQDIVIIIIRTIRY